MKQRRERRNTLSFVADRTSLSHTYTRRSVFNSILERNALRNIISWKHYRSAAPVPACGEPIAARSLPTYTLWITCYKSFLIMCSDLRGLYTTWRVTKTFTTAIVLVLLPTNVLLSRSTKTFPAAAQRPRSIWAMKKKTYRSIHLFIYEIYIYIPIGTSQIRRSFFSSHLMLNNNRNETLKTVLRTSNFGVLLLYFRSESDGKSRCTSEKRFWAMLVVCYNQWIQFEHY